MENRGSFSHYPNNTHMESSLDFEYTKDSRGLEFTLRDPSFRVDNDQYLDTNPNQQSFHLQNNNALTLPLEAIPEQYPVPIPFQYSSSKKEKAPISNSNRKSTNSDAKSSTRALNSIKKFDEYSYKSGRGDVSAERVDIPSRRSTHSRSPSEKLYSSNDSKLSKHKREIQSVGSAKDLSVKNASSSIPSNPSTAPGTDRQAMNSLKREIEELKLRLKNKDSEILEQQRMMEELHFNKKEGGGELKLYKDLKEKSRELEKENEELKHSLRNEILCSERQRSQLDIAKEALNDKLASLNVVANNARYGDTMDLLAEYENLFQKLGKYEQEFYSLTEKQNILQQNLDQLEQKNSELTQALQEYEEEKHRLRDDLQNGIRALQSSRDEQKRLEEEKSNLIDYINGKLTHDESKASDIELLNQKASQLEKDNHELLEKIKKLTYENKELKSLFTKKDDKLNQLMQENAQLISEKETMKDEIEQLGYENSSNFSFYREEIERLKKIKTELEEQNDEIKNELNSTRQKFTMTDLQKGVDEYNTNQAIEDEKTQFFENRIRELLKENSDLILKIQNLEAEMKKISYQKDDYASKTSRYQNRLEEVQQELLDKNINLERVSDTIREMNQDLETKEVEMRDLYHQNKKLKADLENAQESNVQTLKQFEKLADEFEQKLQEIEMYKHDNSNLIAEITDIKEVHKGLIQNLTKKDKNIFEYENKMNMTMTSLKSVEKAVYNIEAENNVLKQENDELKLKLDTSAQAQAKLQKEIQELRDYHLDSENNNRNLAKDIEELARENEKVIQENCELIDLCKGFRVNEKEAAEILDEVHMVIKAFANDLHKNPNNNYFLNYCTANLKEHLSLIQSKDGLEDSKREFKDLAKDVRDWFVLYFEEVRTDVLKLYSNYEELKTARAQILELNRKIDNDAAFVKNAEVDVIEFKEKYTVTRNEKKDLQDRIIKLQNNENVLEKSIMELKEQNTRLNTMVDELKDINFQVKNGYEDLQRELEESRNALDNQLLDKSDKENDFVLLMKENKQLRELIELLTRSIFTQDQYQIAQDLIDVTYECVRIDKESFVIDNNLRKKEQELKIRAQSGSLSVLEISTIRKSIDQLKGELSRSQAELGVFSKRRSLIEEDYLRSEQEERRRFEEGQIIERNIFKNKQEYEEMRLRYEDLVHINKSLQKRVQELASNQYSFQQEDISKIQNRRTEGRMYVTNKENKPNNTEETVTTMKPVRYSSNQYSTQESEQYDKKKPQKIAFQPTDITSQILKASEEDQREVLHSLQMPKLKLKDKLLEARNALYSLKTSQDL